MVLQRLINAPIEMLNFSVYLTRTYMCRLNVFSIVFSSSVDSFMLLWFVCNACICAVPMCSLYEIQIKKKVKNKYDA